MSITFKVSNGFLDFGVINFKQWGKPVLSLTEIGQRVIRKGLIRQNNVVIVLRHTFFFLHFNRCKFGILISNSLKYCKHSMFGAISKISTSSRFSIKIKFFILNE